MGMTLPKLRAHVSERIRKRNTDYRVFAVRTQALLFLPMFQPRNRELSVSNTPLCELLCTEVSSLV